MDKKALLDYALYARKELETQIGLSLNKLGIYKDHITKANIVFHAMPACFCVLSFHAKYYNTNCSNGNGKVLLP